MQRFQCKDLLDEQLITVLFTDRRSSVIGAAAGPTEAPRGRLVA